MAKAPKRLVKKEPGPALDERRCPTMFPPEQRHDYHPVRYERKQESPKIDAARSASMIRVDGKIPQSFGAG
jgi:hypothetical protein